MNYICNYYDKIIFIFGFFACVGRISSMLWRKQRYESFWAAILERHMRKCRLLWAFKIALLIARRHCLNVNPAVLMMSIANRTAIVHFLHVQMFATAVSPLMALVKLKVSLILIWMSSLFLVSLTLKPQNDSNIRSWKNHLMEHYSKHMNSEIRTVSKFLFAEF